MGLKEVKELMVVAGIGGIVRAGVCEVCLRFRILLRILLFHEFPQSLRSTSFPLIPPDMFNLKNEGAAGISIFGILNVFNSAKCYVPLCGRN